MKKLGVVLFVFSLFIWALPSLSYAVQNASFEEDLAKYLGEVSNKRGFNVTRENIEFALSDYGENIENFDTVAELSDFLGEVISADLSNLDEIYRNYGLDETSLRQLLEENGEKLEDYVFLDNLAMALDVYTEDGSVEQEPDFNENLTEYLKQISAIRGFPVTIDHIKNSLANYDSRLEDFSTVAELQDFLGEVIKSDLSNLQPIYDDYGLDEESLRKLLKENGKDLDDYVFIDDLDVDVFAFTFPIDEEMLDGILSFVQEEFGLTDEELDRLYNHFQSIEGSLANPQTLERLEQLADRMMAIPDFETASELSEEQIAELLDIFQDLLDLLQLKVEFSLVKNGSEEPVQLRDLILLDHLTNANLKIKLFSLVDGKFLADLLITGEMVDSEHVVDTGKAINNAVQNVAEAPVKMKKQLKAGNHTMHKTVKGAKLPKTASDYGINAMLGFFILASGIVIYRKVRKA